MPLIPFLVLSMPHWFYIFLFILIAGITGTVGCMSNVGGDTFSVVLLSLTGVVGVCVAGPGVSWLDRSCSACACFSISSKGVLRRVFRQWIRGAACTASRDVGVCESVDVMTTLSTCMV